MEMNDLKRVVAYVAVLALCAALLGIALPAAVFGTDGGVQGDVSGVETSLTSGDEDPGGAEGVEAATGAGENPADDSGGGTGPADGSGAADGSPADLVDGPTDGDPGGQTDPGGSDPSDAVSDQDVPDDSANIPSATALEDEDLDSDPAGENGASPSTDPYALVSTATVSGSGSDAKAVLEAYLTAADTESTTVKPCDIVFVVDQSKWMNTETDEGAQRAQIIEEIGALLDDLAVPDSGEHRVAIAGYGRINMPAGTDPYDASVYPGVQASGSAISLNTGYYTSGGFVSQNGWSDVSQSAMAGSSLPTLPADYQRAMTYDAAFMMVDEARAVLNANTMLSWYSGASRMDAGLTIAEQLAAVAKAHDAAGERNLIVCILASSLPIQNTAYTNQSTVRADAVLAAAAQLKAQGATIFAFGDYHSSGKTIASGLPDTEETFTSVMQQVCTEPGYFYSFSDFAGVTEALNAMNTQIVTVVAAKVECQQTVGTSTFTSADTGRTVTWSELLASYGGAIVEGSVAEVEYYYVSGYDDAGSPVFEPEPFVDVEVPLEDLVSGDGLSYLATLIPVPAYDGTGERPAAHGSKVVITIAAPCTVTYHWYSDEEGYVLTTAQLPASEVVTRGTEHAPASVHYAGGVYDDHYAFEGWYLADGTPYTGTDALTGDVDLYGKWERSVLVSFYWTIWEGYDVPDGDERVAYGGTPASFTPEGHPDGYTFEGWYLDEAYTEPFELNADTRVFEDVNLYAKWRAPEDPDDGGDPDENPGDDSENPGGDDDGSGSDDPDDETPGNGTTEDEEPTPDETPETSETPGTVPDENLTPDNPENPADSADPSTADRSPANDDSTADSSSSGIPGEDFVFDNAINPEVPASSADPSTPDGSDASQGAPVSAPEPQQPAHPTIAETADHAPNAAPLLVAAGAAVAFGCVLYAAAAPRRRRG